MNRKLITTGWCEWVALTEFGLPWIKARIDSGERHAILHACYLEPFEKNGKKMVRFGLHPLQHNRKLVVFHESTVINAHRFINRLDEQEMHYIVTTNLALGKHQWPVRLELTERDDMDFRLILGHDAIDGRLLVDPAKRCLLGTPSDEDLRTAYAAAQSRNQKAGV